jgi:hypothetical protein
VDVLFSTVAGRMCRECKSRRICDTDQPTDKNLYEFHAELHRLCGITDPAVIRQRWIEETKTVPPGMEN